MSCAPRLVDVSISNAPSSSPAPVSTLYPTTGYAMRASRRPTFAPTSRTTVIPMRTGSFATEPPATQRSATVHPRFEAAARQEATNLLAILRLNLDFLQSLLQGPASALAVTALSDLHQAVDCLEQRLRTSAFAP
jgi:hypothetical protein